MRQKREKQMQIKIIVQNEYIVTLWRTEYSTQDFIVCHNDDAGTVTILNTDGTPAPVWAVKQYESEYN